MQPITEWKEKSRVQDDSGFSQSDWKYAVATRQNGEHCGWSKCWSEDQNFQGIASPIHIVNQLIVPQLKREKNKILSEFYRLWQNNPEGNCSPRRIKLTYSENSYPASWIKTLKLFKLMGSSKYCISLLSETLFGKFTFSTTDRLGTREDKLFESITAFWIL